MEIKHVIINGKYMAERMQGIVRYAREIVNELDKIIDENMKVTLAIPSNSHDVPPFYNIEVVKLGKNKGIIWEQTDLRRYIKKHKSSICLNLCNVAPLFVQPGITVVHDIMYKANPDHYKNIRNRISRRWHTFQYKYLFKHEKMIITVSKFSKQEIEKYYPVTKGKIEIVPNGWQHIMRIKPTKDWRNHYPFLSPGNYYFSLSTLSKNKNGIWIYKVAEKNPEAIFAIGGKNYECEEYPKPKNVHLLGFVSDEDACALMLNCKAFIFPSLYEGFGIPPLEALALGAQVITSNTTSLPEILGNSVHYIDPHIFDYDLSKILSEKINSSEAVLNKYGWSISAKKLIKILIECK